MLNTFNFILLSFAISIYSWDPSKPLPSCLIANTTWDQSGVFDVILNIESADLCQVTCDETETCTGFTWLSPDSAMFPQGCALFSSTESTLDCEHCVSGLPECPCTIRGECDSQEDNMIEAFPQVASVEDCHDLCRDVTECSHYTYFSESHLSQLCLLFSSCENLYEGCEDCLTGARECTICSFENTINGECFEEKCEEGWESFENNCYRLLDNSGSHYRDINQCKQECEASGGNLTSIHSQEENDFLVELLRPTKAGFAEQTTWIGAVKRGESFEWMDGSMMDFSNWRSGHPNDGGNCILLGYYPSNPDQWDDWTCVLNIDTDCICKM